MIGAVTLAAVGGLFAAVVSSQPPVYLVGWDPGPVVVVAVTDVVIIGVIIFENVLFAAVRDTFAAVDVVLGSAAPAWGRIWWR